MSHKVMFIAVNKKYRDIPLYVGAPYDERKDKFVTGQEHLSPDDLLRQPFVIEEGKQYPVTNRMTLECSVRPDKFKIAKPQTKDDVLYNFYMLAPEISPTKSKVDRSVHLFYVQDFEMEAEEDISKADSKFEANKIVRENMSLSRMKDLAIFLDLPVSNYSTSFIQAKIYDHCDKFPDKVLAFFDEKHMTELTIKKLLHHGILRRKGKEVWTNGFTMLVGSTFNEAVSYFNNSDHDQYTDNWTRQLAAIESGEEAPNRRGRKKVEE